MTQQNFESVLVTTTRELLVTRPRNIDYAIIEQETALSRRWLTSFATKSSDDFSVTKVEKLYTYLAGKPLKL